VTYAGIPGYPMDGLIFATTAFADPQGAGTFKAMEWRCAEVTPVANPGSIPLSDPRWKQAPMRLELEAVWTSGELPVFSSTTLVPVRAVSVGHTYRVRVRMQDGTDLWSHWSAPVEFTATGPSSTVHALADLRVTELMLQPAGGRGEEFIELRNIGTHTLDLADVWFSDGIEFAFAGSAVTTLPPGAFVLVVRDRAAFERRYDTRGMAIAGEYGKGLDKNGERIALTYGGNLTILDFHLLEPLVSRNRRPGILAHDRRRGRAAHGVVRPGQLAAERRAPRDARPRRRGRDRRIPPARRCQPGRRARH